MPTSRVQPGDSELLQAIANALTRAKKVVVVTGAGISTNSGIPDFRSENGLYKLIQDQYDATARAAASQAALPPPPPALKSATSDPGQASSRLEEFPEDRPKKRQKLSPPDKEESALLPEITVGDGDCVENAEQVGEHGNTRNTTTKTDVEGIKGSTGFTDIGGSKTPRNDTLPKAQYSKALRHGRASSLPPARRRISARLNPHLRDTLSEETSHTAPAEVTSIQTSADAWPGGLPSTPRRTRRQTILAALPGGSSPLSDLPSHFSSSSVFDHPTYLRSSSPLSDPPSRLATSPFIDRLASDRPIFDRDSSPLSDPPQVGSSPFLGRAAYVRGSSPLSDPLAHLGSSPPSFDRLARPPSSPPRDSRLITSASSPLSSPPRFVIDPRQEISLRRNPRRGRSSPRESREITPDLQASSASVSSLGEQDSNTTGIEGPSSQPVSRESSLVPDSQPASRSEGRESPERDEIRCASTPPATRLETSTSLPATEGSQSSQEQSSILASSQGSTASARLPIPNIKGRDLFDASIWSCPIRTSVFYTFATTLRQKVRDVTPTSSHFFISHLRDRGKLVRCYTQNIDRIEEKVGLSTSLDQGPGQRSRFSTRRPPVLSRVNSGAPGASSADSAPSSSSASTPGGQGGGPTSSNATDSRAPASGQEEISSEVREHGGEANHGQSGPGSGLSRVSDGASADGPCNRGPAAPPRNGTDPAGPGSSQRGSGTGGGPTADGAHQQPSLPGDLRNLSAPKRDGDKTANDVAAGTTAGPSVQNEDSGQERGSETRGQPCPEAAEAAPSSQESTESSQTGLTTAPKPQRQSSSSGGVECVFLHGSLECLRCFLCRRVCEWEGDDREEQTLSGRQPECPHCAGATAAREERGKRALGVGKLRPDIVLYGEEHPSAHLISPIVTHDLGLGPDLLLILGTSLKVHGLKVLVRQFAKAVHSKGGKVVFVNFTKPPESSWGDVIDYWVEWDCDAWVGDLKEKAPVLWLPPGTEEPKKRKSIGGRGGAEKKIIGEKRKITPANAKKAGTKSKDEGTAGGSITVSSRVETITTTINVATGAPLESIVCTEETTVKVSAPEPSAHDLLWAGSREAYRENPPKQGRVGLRDDKANGAYSTWKIMESLRRISGRPAPPPMELPTVEISRAIGVAETKEAKREWKRKKRSSLALAREEAAAGQGSDTPPVKRGDTPHLQGVDDSPPAQATPNNPPAQSRMPEVWSIHSSGPPLTHGSTLPAVPNGGVVTSKKRKALPGLNMGTRMKQGRLGPLVDQAPLTSTPAKSDSQEQPLPNTSTLAMMDPRKREPFVHQQQTPSPFPAEQAPRPSTPPSILAAVKSNPRKRKRKMIDGEEVVLPTMGTRVKLPPPAPAGKENRDVAHHHSRQKIPSLVAAHNDADFSSITLAPLQQPMTPRGWQQKQKPEPMEPMSSPRGPASGFSGLSRMSVSGRLGDPFFYEDALIRVGSERRVVRDVRDERGAEGVVGVNRGVLSEREMAAARALTGMIR